MTKLPSGGDTRSRQPAAIARECLARVRRTARRNALIESDTGPAFTRADLSLYVRLLAERGGPHGHQIQSELGRLNNDLYDHLDQRASDRLAALPNDADWEPDEIDLAALRAVAQATIIHHHDGCFDAVTGRRMDEVRELLDRSRDTTRRRRWLAPGLVGIQLGGVLVRFPEEQLRTGRNRPTRLVAVPSPHTWAAAVPAELVDRRDEVLAILRAGAPPWESIIEFSATSHLELRRRLIDHVHDHQQDRVPDQP